LFGLLKERLKEHELSTREETIEAITAIWDFVTFDEIQSVFAEWIQRLTWVIAKRGEFDTQGLKQVIYYV
jgi:hypothetical protein